MFRICPHSRVNLSGTWRHHWGHSPFPLPVSWRPAQRRARPLARSPALPFSPEAAAIKRLINKAGYRFCRHFSRKSIFLQPMSFKTIAFTFLWNACTCTYTRRHVQNVKKQEGHVLLEPAAPMFHLLIFGNVSLKTVLLLIGKFSLTWETVSLSLGEFSLPLKTVLLFIREISLLLKTVLLFIGEFSLPLKTVLLLITVLEGD